MSTPKDASENSDIKFRAWDGTSFHYWKLSLPKKNLNQAQRFTGAEDCDKVLIYEHDIVEAVWESLFEDKKFRGIVIWDETMSAFYIDCLWDGVAVMLKSPEIDEIKVIGNEDENPELLDI